jgi:hypothetical protein
VVVVVVVVVVVALAPLLWKNKKLLFSLDLGYMVMNEVSLVDKSFQYPNADDTTM